MHAAAITWFLTHLYVPFKFTHSLPHVYLLKLERFTQRKAMKTKRKEEWKMKKKKKMPRMKYRQAWQTKTDRKPTQTHAKAKEKKRRRQLREWFLNEQRKGVGWKENLSKIISVSHIFRHAENSALTTFLHTKPFIFRESKAPKNHQHITTQKGFFFLSVSRAVTRFEKENSLRGFFSPFGVCYLSGLLFKSRTKVCIRTHA